MTAWDPTEEDFRRYLTAACGELAQAVCELRPGWEEVVRYPEAEGDPEGWEEGVPSHHVAARAPDGRALDVRGWSDDPRWAAAPLYDWRFKLSAEDRDVARRLLGAVDPADVRD